jgi:pimeloyl-ACP methyl ester carboxylesterase
MGLRHLVLAGVAMSLLAACGAQRLPKMTAEQDCRIGVYRLADGRLLDIGPAEGADLRWRLQDGQVGRLHADRAWAATVGWTDRPDTTAVRWGDSCEGVTLVSPRGSVEGRRVALEVRDISFKSGGQTLFGRLVLPPGAEPVPIIVQVHGSEKTAASLYNHTQRLVPAQGVGVFVYDKRGTGRSTGDYTQDFQVLGRDAAAAAVTARRLARGRAGRVGFEGGSQGGWVAPIAANLTPVDFVIVGYGLADSPFAENRDEALQDIAYHGPGARAGALEVIAATEAVMASNFTSGFEQLEAAKARYGKAAWFKDLRGEFTGDLAKYPGWILRIVGPTFNQQTPWTYDPLPTLRRLEAPTLWVLAGEDTAAPVAETRRRLLALRAQGRPITVLEFPKTEHGMYTFETDAKGERRKVRYAEGYFETSLDWARTGALAGPYGDAVLLTPGPTAGSRSGVPAPPTPGSAARR